MAGRAPFFANQAVRFYQADRFRLAKKGSGYPFVVAS